VVKHFTWLQSGLLLLVLSLLVPPPAMAYFDASYAAYFAQVAAAGALFVILGFKRFWRYFAARFGASKEKNEGASDESST